MLGAVKDNGRFGPSGMCDGCWLCAIDKGCCLSPYVFPSLVRYKLLRQFLQVQFLILSVFKPGPKSIPYQNPKPKTKVKPICYPVSLTKWSPEQLTCHHFREECLLVFSSILGLLEYTLISRASSDQRKTAEVQWLQFRYTFYMSLSNNTEISVQSFYYTSVLYLKISRWNVPNVFYTIILFFLLSFSWQRPVDVCSHVYRVWC